MEGLLALALVAGLDLAVPAAQDAAQDELALRESRRHAATVLEERRERLLSLYSRADEEARRRAAVALERLHSTGAGLVAPPSLRAVDKAARAIEGGGEGWLQELADSLDLRVMPGAFEARREGRTPMIVIVEPLYAVTGVRDVELELHWIAPDGSEQRARREPVAASAFQPPGFDMFVSPPVGPPAAWRLVAELEHDAQRVRGIPVRVDGIADFRGRLEALGAPPQPGTPEALFREALASLLQRGVRRLVGFSSTDMLACAEGEERGPRPLAPGWRDEDGGDHWVFALDPPEEPPAQQVILLAAGHEAPESVLSRPAWAEYARAQRARVLSTRLPHAAADGPAEGSAVVALLTELRRHAAGAPTLVVARGDSVGQLLLGLIGCEQPPFDGAVFSTVVNTAPGEILPQVPRVLVAPGGHRDLAAAREAARESGPPLLWIDGSRTPLLNEPELPDICARFFAAELARDRGGR